MPWGVSEHATEVEAHARRGTRGVREHMRNVSVPERCPNCGSKHLTRDRDFGETFCADCGTVVAAPPTLRVRDIRRLENGEAGGEPTSIMSPTKDLGSVITDTTDASGRPLTNQFKFSRLRRMQNSERYLD
jgi:transcription initiation factor TFIIIB Brf1 subunit/transcription initiation factor TFIIB